MRKTLTSLLAAALLSECFSSGWAQGPLAEVLGTPWAHPPMSAKAGPGCATSGAASLAEAQDWDPAPYVFIYCKSSPGGMLVIGSGARRYELAPSEGPIAKAMGPLLTSSAPAPQGAPSPALDSGCQDEPISRIGDGFTVFFQETKRSAPEMSARLPGCMRGLEWTLPDSTTAAKCEAPLVAFSPCGDDGPGGWVSAGAAMYFVKPCGLSNSAGQLGGSSHILAGSSVELGYRVTNGFGVQANWSVFAGGTANNFSR